MDAKIQVSRPLVANNDRNVPGGDLPNLLPDAHPSSVVVGRNPESELESTPSPKDPTERQLLADLSAPGLPPRTPAAASPAAFISTPALIDRLNQLISSNDFRRRRHSPDDGWPAVAELISRALPQRAFQTTVAKVTPGIPVWYSADMQQFGVSIGNLPLDVIDTINEQLTHDIAFLYHALSLAIDRVVALEFYTSEIGAQLVLDAVEGCGHNTNSDSAHDAAAHFVYPAVCSLYLALKCAHPSADSEVDSEDE